MNPGTKEVIVRGILRPDGTVELCEQPALAAGPIDVVLRPLALAEARESTWDVLQRIHAQSSALGIQPRTAAAIDAEINALRDESERPVTMTHAEADESGWDTPLSTPSTIYLERGENR